MTAPQFPAVSFRPVIIRSSSDRCCVFHLTQNPGLFPGLQPRRALLPGLEAVMSGNHVMDETRQDAPASPSALPALPVQTAAYNLFSLSSAHLSHGMFSFSFETVFSIYPRIVGYGILTSHGGTARGGVDDSVSAGSHPALIRWVLLF